MARDRRKRNGRRAGSFRTCVGCRDKRSADDLLRVVLSPEGEVLADLYGKLPGRGVHLCPNIKCFELAVSRNAFSRAFKRRVDPPDPVTLCMTFYKSGIERIKSLLATAARSGWLKAGRDAVRASMKKKSSSLVLLAEDSSKNLQTQIVREAIRVQVPLRKILTKSELGRFHKARPLAVLTITHRGIGKRLSKEIDRVASLFIGSEAGSGLAPGHNELTGSDDRGMMPQTQASA